MDSETQAAIRWWQSMVLSPNELEQKHIRPAPTVFKAKLRRCDTAEAAMMTEGFRALWFSLPEEVISQATERDMERWATIAAALVYVKPNTWSNEKSIAYMAGSRTEGDKSTVSELRFSQFQAADTPNIFLRRLRRVLTQVKGDVSAESLVRDISHWFNEHYSFFPRKADRRIAVKWAMDYYRAAASSKK